MKYPIFFMLLVMVSCTNPEQEKVPGEKPDPTQEQALLKSIIRYTGKMPDKASYITRFDTSWDAHYEKALALHRIDRLYESEENNTMYLLVSRPAPSLQEKRVSIGIQLRMEADSITYYNEVFRTWKMTEKELLPKSEMLFAKMIQGKDLSPWYPETAQDGFIEFPDKNTYFDTIGRHWVSRLEDPIAPYREINQQHGDSL